MHYQDASDLMQAADLNCYICIRLLDECFRRCDEIPSNSILNVDYDLTGAWKRNMERGITLRFHVSYAFAGSEGGRFHRYFYLIQGMIHETGPPRKHCLERHDPGKTPWLSDSDSLDRDLSTHTSHESVFRLASEWLRKCLRDHKSCDRSHDQTWYPKRLLDLRNQQVRLILTASTQPRGPYASMSHCWGPHPFFLTLSAERIEEMRRDIQWARLPRNFQDAITTCRRLGIDYLWIDSLCIIQSGYGSAEDWTEHATLMQFVYANSILTIAATRAASAEGGCFTERDPDLVYPPTVIWSGRQAAAHSDDELWDDGDSHYLSDFTDEKLDMVDFGSRKLYIVDFDNGKSDIEDFDDGKSDMEDFNDGKKDMEDIKDGKLDMEDFHDKKSNMEDFDNRKSDMEDFNDGKSDIEDMEDGKLDVEDFHNGKSDMEDFHDESRNHFAESGPQHIWWIVDEHLYGRKFMNSPLGQRAWVFQERLLSKRMLHFGLDQIFWECDELPNASETFPLGLPDLNPLNDGVARFNIVPSSSIQEYRKGRPLDDSDGLESNWYQIVENYSALELTRPVEDKFVALAGIASRTAALLGDSYVAGMFRKDLSRALLWRIVDTGLECGRRSKRWTGPYIAPSWSWASIDGRVSFKKRECVRTLVDINQVSIDLVENTNQFGQVRAAEICLHGHIIPKGTALIFCIHFDNLRLSNRDHSKDVFFPVAVHKGEKLGVAEEALGLVLEAVPTIPGKYTRVGMFKAPPRRILSYLDERSEPTEVRII